MKTNILVGGFKVHLTFRVLSLMILFLFYFFFFCIPSHFLEDPGITKLQIICFIILMLWILTQPGLKQNIYQIHQCQSLPRPPPQLLKYIKNTFHIPKVRHILSSFTLSFYVQRSNYKCVTIGNIMYTKRVFVLAALINFFKTFYLFFSITFGVQYYIGFRCPV